MLNQLLFTWNHNKYNCLDLLLRVLTLSLSRLFLICAAVQKGVPPGRGPDVHGVNSALQADVSDWVWWGRWQLLPAAQLPGLHSQCPYSSGQGRDMRTLHNKSEGKVALIYCSDSFAYIDSRGVYPTARAPPGGADWHLPSVQREDAVCLQQVHPEGLCGRGLQRTSAVEFYQLSG